MPAVLRRPSPCHLILAGLLALLVVRLIARPLRELSIAADRIWTTST